MKVDLYTKAVLTVIAASLAVIAFRAEIRPAMAFNEGCGDKYNPCYVDYHGSLLGGLPVKIMNQ